MQSSLTQQLRSLFNPSSVAVIGATSNFGTWGFAIFHRVLTTSAPRKVYPVNKNLSEVRGVKAYQSILEIPDPVDFAVIAISAPQVPAVMRECAQKGVKAALIISGGFAEADEMGAKLQEEVVQIARQSGMRFVGPNCMGHFSTSADFFTVGFLPRVRKGPISFISQSGTFGNRMLLHGLETGIGYCRFVSSGNEADIHLEDYVEYLGQDDETRVITAFIEGLREGKRFFSLAREITRKKPIVVMKAGKTRGGGKAARSHSSALAGSDAVFDSVCRQSGVIRVEEDDELFDVAVALLHLPLPRGNRVGMLTEGGGAGVVASDVCEQRGLKLVDLSPATMDKLNNILPRRWSHGNPVDMVAAQSVTFPCLFALMEDADVDSLLLIGGIGSYSSYAAHGKPRPEIKALLDKFVAEKEEEEAEGLGKVLQLMDKSGKPLVISALLGDVVKNSRAAQMLQQGRGMLIYPSPQRAAKVLAHLTWYSEYLRNAG